MYRTFTGFPFDFAQGGEPVEPRILLGLGGLVRNDGFGELWLSLQGGEDISSKILKAPTFGRRD